MRSVVDVLAFWPRRRDPAPMLGEDVRAELAEEVDVGGGREGKVTVFDRLKSAHCGGIHSHACPRVKRMRFKPTSYSGEQQLVEIEFWPSGEWSREGIIFPWHVFADGHPPTPELSSPGSNQEGKS